MRIEIVTEREERLEQEIAVLERRILEARRALRAHGCWTPEDCADAGHCVCEVFYSE